MNNYSPLIVRIALSLVAIVFAGASSWILLPRTITTHAIEKESTDAELYKDADVVVSGTLAKPRSSFLEINEPSSLITRWQFLIEKTYKGKEQPSVTVVTPGGKLGNTKVQLAGGPNLTAGVSAILFLQYSPDLDSYVVLSMVQGVLLFDGSQYRSMKGLALSENQWQAKVKQIQAE